MSLPEGSIVDGPKAQLTQLPSVDRLLRRPAAQALIARHGATLVTEQGRAVLATLRHEVLTGSVAQILPDSTALDGMLQARCAQRLAPCLKPIINLTGTVIHTNLGRSVLPQVAIDYLCAMMASPLNLEYDLATGTRGERDSLVEGLICDITGAEAATVVNNNAAAVLLTLAALARGKQVIVSRGELVEIGGAFRMPDVMDSAGALMVEVGTTNRTHLRDYELAITTNTAVLLKVHTSNYVVQGFTAAVPERELATLARARGVLLASDLGSGSLIDLSRYGLPKEPTPQELLAEGCDVVMFSADKLLGGPQAGLIVGSKVAINQIRRFPMKRALRLSKLPLAALEATLRLYLQPELLTTHLPTLRWLTRAQAQVEATAHELVIPFTQAVAPHYAVSHALMKSQIGSGSLPIDTIASAGLKISPVASKTQGVGRALERLSRALRELPSPIIGRIESDCLLLDCRCVDDIAPILCQLPLLKDALT